MQKRMEDKPEGKEPSLKQHTRQALQYNQSWKQLGKHQPIISLQKKKKTKPLAYIRREQRNNKTSSCVTM